MPDDKEPSIVFDPVKKQWVDKNTSDQVGAADFPPPPPMNTGSTFQNKPNSTLTSPQNHFPSSPTFSSIEPNQQPQSWLPNGTLPSLPTFPSVSMSGTNQFRSGIRKNRYIDVFNASTSKMEPEQK